MKGLIIALAITVFCIAVGITGLRIDSETFVPQEEKVQPVWLPQNAEVRPVEAVVPGTFKIKLSFEEFQSTVKTEQPVLVVYGRGATPLVEYWSSKGDGTFYYTVKTIPYPDSLFLQQWKSPNFNREAGGYVFVSQKDGYFFALGVLFLLIGGIIMVMILGIVWTERSAGRRPKSSEL